MAVSNAIGSNVFDIFVGIGVVYVVYMLVTGTKSIEVDQENLISSVLLLFATIIALITMLIARKWRLGKLAGVLLIGLYVGYLVWIVTTSL